MVDQPFHGPPNNDTGHRANEEWVQLHPPSLPLLLSSKPLPRSHPCAAQAPLGLSLPQVLQPSWSFPPRRGELLALLVVCKWVYTKCTQETAVTQSCHQYCCLKNRMDVCTQRIATEEDGRSWPLLIKVTITIKTARTFFLHMAQSTIRMVSNSATSYRLKFEGFGSRYLLSYWKPEKKKKCSKMLGHSGQFIGNCVYGICITVGDYVILCTRANETSIAKGQQCPSSSGIASSHGHTQLFSVERRKAGGHGTCHHVMWMR